MSFLILQGFVLDPTHPITSLDLLEFHALILADPFPDFPKLYSSRFMVVILAPPVHALKFCFLLWLLLHMHLVQGTPLEPSWLLLYLCPANEFPFSWGLPRPPHSQSRQMGQLLPKEIGKLVFPVVWGLIFARGCGCPWSVCETAAS